MAVARGQTQVAGTMVLCTGTGPLAVAVDADGQPTGPTHVCPDCALGLFDAAATDPHAKPLPGQWIAFAPLVPHVPAAPLLALGTPRTRAPPLV